jgi:hypothetical protein
MMVDAEMNKSVQSSIFALLDMDGVEVAELEKETQIGEA